VHLSVTREAVGPPLAGQQQVVVSAFSSAAPGLCGAHVLLAQAACAPAESHATATSQIPLCSRPLQGPIVVWCTSFSVFRIWPRSVTVRAIQLRLESLLQCVLLRETLDFPGAASTVLQGLHAHSSCFKLQSAAPQASRQRVGWTLQKGMECKERLAVPLVQWKPNASLFALECARLGKPWRERDYESSWPC
jgi:hypothetical protein